MAAKYELHSLCSVLTNKMLKLKGLTWMNIIFYKQSFNAPIGIMHNRKCEPILSQESNDRLCGKFKITLSCLLQTP